MNLKLAIMFVTILLAGIAIGAIGQRAYAREEFDSAVKLADSLQTVEAERQRVFDIFIKEKGGKVKQVQTRIKKRNENFKNDTTILGSSELLQRIRAINDHD